MTASTQVGLFAPPVLAALVFLIACGRETVAGRKLAKEKITFLAWFSVALMIAGYVIVWHKEILALLG